MDDVTPIRIPQDNVNDDRVLILEWLVADGATVAADQVLVEVETSKSVFEVTAPHAGVLRILTPSNREIPVGDVLCLVGPSLEAIDRSRRSAGPAQAAAPQAVSVSPVAPAASAPAVILSPAPAIAAAAPPFRSAPQSTRFSRQALEILQQRGLAPATFAGRGLLRARDLDPAPVPPPVDVICRTAGRDEPPAAAIVSRPTDSADAPASRSAAGVPYQSEPLSRIKRVESRLLAWSTREAIRSSVSVLVPTAGRARIETADPDAAENRTAFLIQASATLLRRYPLLNACCLGEEIRRYEQVHIGYAIDGGKGLKVPVLREADTRTLAAIAAERRRFVTAYLAESLRPAEFAGGTFTITDLSGAGVLTCDPLLSEGQSGILGIGAEHGPPDSLNQQFVLAFDHRLVEGRMAAAFLSDLKGELVEYERTLLGNSEALADRSAEEPSCSRCGMTVSRASARHHFLVSVAGARPGREAFVCTVCLRGR